MSAYLVGSRTINTILAGIKHAREGHYMHGPRCAPRQYPYLGLTDLPKLGFALAWMNQDAVDQRYRGEWEAKPYIFQTAIPPHLIKLHKAIRCLLYQCTEGNVDQRELYLELEEFGHWTAHAFMTTRPEYEQARWG